MSRGEYVDKVGSGGQLSSSFAAYHKVTCKFSRGRGARRDAGQRPRSEQYEVVPAAGPGSIGLFVPDIRDGWLAHLERLGGKGALFCHCEWVLSFEPVWLLLPQALHGIEVAVIFVVGINFQ